MPSARVLKHCAIEFASDLAARELCVHNGTVYVQKASKPRGELIIIFVLVGRTIAQRNQKRHDLIIQHCNLAVAGQYLVTDAKIANVTT